MADSLGEVLCDEIAAVIDDMSKAGIPLNEINATIEQRIEDTYSKLVDISSKDTVLYLKEHMYEIAHEADAADAVFLARQEHKWGKCFAASHTMYVIVTEAAEIYCKYIQDSIEESKYIANQYTFLALQHLHGRACQEFLEILTLMRAGFADGAYARWRSMYELSCIAAFIKEHGERIAKQYYKQADTDNQHYTWTDGALDSNGKKISSFKQLQDCLQIDEAWRKQYKLA